MGCTLRWILHVLAVLTYSPSYRANKVPVTQRSDIAFVKATSVTVEGAFNVKEQGGHYTEQVLRDRRNFEWIQRTKWADDPIMESAIDIHSGVMQFVAKFGAYMVINLPVNECELLKGRFECECLGRRQDWTNVNHAVDYYTFPEAYNKLDPKCANVPTRTDAEKNAITTFSQKEFTLSREYQDSMKPQRIRRGWILTKDAVEVISNTERFPGEKFKVLELTARIKKNYRKVIDSVPRFYVFYVPPVSIPQEVRYLLVGLVRDKAMWEEVFNFRNYPILQRAIKADMWEGTSGSGFEAYFKVAIRFEPCEVLQGGFEFETFVKSDNEKRTLYADYKLGSGFTTLRKSCLQESKNISQTEAEQDEDDLDESSLTGSGKTEDIKQKNGDSVRVDKAKKPESSDNTAVVVVVVVICVLLIIAGVVLFLKYKQRKNAQPKEVKQPILEQKAEIDDEEKKRRERRERRERRRARRKKREAEGEEGRRRRKSKRRSEDEGEKEKQEEGGEAEAEESKNNSSLSHRYRSAIYPQHSSIGHYHTNSMAYPDGSKHSLVQYQRSANALDQYQRSANALDWYQWSANSLDQYQRSANCLMSDHNYVDYQSQRSDHQGHRSRSHPGQCYDNGILCMAEVSRKRRMSEIGPGNLFDQHEYYRQAQHSHLYGLDDSPTKETEWPECITPVHKYTQGTRQHPDRQAEYYTKETFKPKFITPKQKYTQGANQHAGRGDRSYSREYLISQHKVTNLASVPKCKDSQLIPDIDEQVGQKNFDNDVSKAEQENYPSTQQRVQTTDLPQNYMYQRIRKTHTENEQEPDHSHTRNQGSSSLKSEIVQNPDLCIIKKQNHSSNRHRGREEVKATTSQQKGGNMDDEANRSGVKSIQAEQAHCSSLLDMELEDLPDQPMNLSALPDQDVNVRNNLSAVPDQDVNIRNNLYAVPDQDVNVRNDLSAVPDQDVNLGNNLSASMLKRRLSMAPSDVTTKTEDTGKCSENTEQQKVTIDPEMERPSAWSVDYFSIPTTDQVVMEAERPDTPHVPPPSPKKRLQDSVECDD